MKKIASHVSSDLNRAKGMIRQSSDAGDTSARFLSPDPVLQDAGNLQAHNRYSYCLNNPLKYIDPTGYFFDDPRSGKPLGEPGTSYGSYWRDELASGNTLLKGHWSNAYRSEFGNFMLMTSSAFINTYGAKKYNELYAQVANVTKTEEADPKVINPGNTMNGDFLRELISFGFTVTFIPEYGTFIYGVGDPGVISVSDKGIQTENRHGVVKSDEISSGEVEASGQGGQVQQAGFEGGEHLIGPALIALGQPINALKPIGALGSKPGSSIASYTLSKAIPQTFTKTLGKEVGTKVATSLGTNVIGRAFGRLVPYVGWGMTFYDVVDLTIGWDRVMTPASNDQWVPNRAVFPDGTTIYVCFKAGTQILAKEGIKSIEQINVGDSVYSYNLEKNIVELSKVVKSFKRETWEIYKLTTNDQKIYVTSEHPFYVEGKGWVKVKDLQKGFELKTKANATEYIVSIINSQRQETVYNIEVEGNHNYFVTTSYILVHNK